MFHRVSSNLDHLHENMGFTLCHLVHFVSWPETFVSRSSCRTFVDLLEWCCCHEWHFQSPRSNPIVTGHYGGMANVPHSILMDRQLLFHLWQRVYPASPRRTRLPFTNPLACIPHRPDTEYVVVSSPIWPRVINGDHIQSRFLIQSSGELGWTVEKGVTVTLNHKRRRPSNLVTTPSGSHRLHPV